jgi:hypothetical protein
MMVHGVGIRELIEFGAQDSESEQLEELEKLRLLQKQASLLLP